MNDVAVGVWRALMERWPGWSVEFRSHAPEVSIYPLENKLVIRMSPRLDARTAGVARALAHLDLGHHYTAYGRFTAEQEATARQLARHYLDIPSAA